jgi:hypothetical protein
LFILSLQKKLEIRAEQILPESKVGESWWGSGGEGEEMAQTMYAHMNKQEKIGKNSKNKYILVLKKKKESSCKPAPRHLLYVSFFPPFLNIQRADVSEL